MPLRDRYRGALLGLAVGDALGTTLEFRAPGTFAPLTDMVGGGPFRLPAGAWTDDTSMALCLAESLVTRRGFAPVDQLERYVRWWREGHLSVTGRCFDIGTTVRGALERFVRTREPWSGSTDPATAGNGSLMRLAPAVLAFASAPRQAVAMAAASSRTTHGAPAAVDACRWFASLLLRALAGDPKPALLAARPEPPCDPSVAEVASGSFARREPPDVRGGGYVVECLEAALWAFHRTATFRDGALAAVNLGDDADTTGAVYGQLAGAYYGETGIPPAWRERLAWCERIAALADDLHLLAQAHREPHSPLPALPPATADTYHATWFEYVDAAGRRFTARPVDAPPAAAPAWDLPDEFAVVTAWNPGSTPRPSPENDAANRRLHADLLARGGAVRDLVGRAADGGWQEASFAVWNVPLGELARLAADHGQHAIFVVDGGRRTLGCGDRQVDPERGVWLAVSRDGA